MIQPIYVFGNPELRRQTFDVPRDSKAIQGLIDDMLDTMAHAKGIGLAAPQIGRSERIFVVDVSPLADDFEEAGTRMPPQPMIFINARITESSDCRHEFEEGCLSIPDIHEDVLRPEIIRIEYLDREFSRCEEEYEDMLARVVQHEYDHVEGILFIDHVTSLRRRLLKRRLKNISDGEMEADYPVYISGKGVLTP